MDASFVPGERARLREGVLAQVAFVGADVLVAHVVHNQPRATREHLSAVTKIANIVRHEVILTLSHLHFLVVVCRDRSHVHLLRGG